MAKLHNKHFQYADLLCEFVNTSNIEVIAISSEKFSEGFTLFYKNK